jgi:hypothetical protein
MVSFLTHDARHQRVWTISEGGGPAGDEPGGRRTTVVLPDIAASHHRRGSAPRAVHGARPTPDDDGHQMLTVVPTAPYAGAAPAPAPARPSAGEAADLRAALAAPHDLRPGRDDGHEVTNLDFYIRRHRVLACGEAVDTARTLCHEVGVEPLIDELRHDGRDAREYVWIGYELPSAGIGTGAGGQVIFHAGWLDYCEQMGGPVARALTRRLGGSPYRDALAHWRAG